MYGGCPARASSFFDFKFVLGCLFNKYTKNIDIRIYFFKNILFFTNERDSKKNKTLKNLEEAVKSAYKNTKKDGVCILSPAASSYNEYKNFEEKGKHYKELVNKL